MGKGNIFSVFKFILFSVISFNFNSKKNKKAIGPVVATALLLVVAVGSVTMFQGWFQTYQSSMFTGVETQSAVGSQISVEGLIDNILYLKSGSDINLSTLKVTDGNGNEMCSFSGSIYVNSSGLVDWWTFDKIINNSGILILPDMSGNGNNGTLKDANVSNSDGNTTPQLVKSKLGNALEFDGVDDYVEGKDSISSFQYLSIESKIYLNVIPNGLAKIYFNGDTSSGRDISLGINNDLSLYCRADAPAESDINIRTSEINTISLNKWYIIDVVFDSINNVEKKYVNGKLINMDTYNSNIPIANYKDEIGRFYDGGLKSRSYFNGQIDEIRIYNRTLSDSEIKTLYWYSIKPQQKGVNQIDLSSCNLNKGNVYNVVAFTKNQKVEHTLVAR